MRFGAKTARAPGAQSRAATRAAMTVAVGAVISLAAACSADRTKASPIRLSIFADKGLLETADSVTLKIFAGAQCKGAALAGTPDPSSKVGDDHSLIKPGAENNNCSNNKSQWCVTLQVAFDPTTPLTWYVEGTQAAKTSFTGCTVQAVNQDPLTVPITIQRVIEGSKCGDGVIGATETCDPGSGGATDEACDATTCQTKEVVLSNGAASNQFYAGLPARKTGTSLLYGSNDRLFGIWSDGVTAAAGADGPAEITWRRLTGNVTTDTSVTLVQQELRLPVFGSSVGVTGAKKRNGTALSPSLDLLPSGDLLVVFSRQPSGEVFHVFGVVQPQNMNGPTAADFEFASSTSPQTSPASAVSSSGDVLAVWLESNVVHGALRKASGAISASAPVSTSGTASGPRVAWVGGDFVVVWSDGDDIKMRNVGADGTPKGTEQVVNATHRTGKQDAPDIAALPTGEFAVAWESSGESGDDGVDIRAQRFDRAGNPAGNEADAPLDVTNHGGDQTNPAIAVGTLSGGASFYWVAWIDAARGTISSRIVSGAGGFLFNNVDGQKDDFDVTATPRLVSSPSVTVGGASPGFVAVGFTDDSEEPAGNDDDRVRVRRFPLPTP